MIAPGVPKAITAPIAADISNTQALGLVLYTRYVYFFQAAGLILLVAMIGAIVMTLQHKPGVKRQSIAGAGRAPALDRHRYRQSEVGAGAHMITGWGITFRSPRSCSRSGSSASFSTARTSSSS